MTDDHVSVRQWLAKTLLDERLSDAEAFGVVAYHPSIKDTRPQSDLTREGVADVLRKHLRIDRQYMPASSEHYDVLAGIPEAADAILAMVPGGVPDGWKLVPVEPTTEGTRQMNEVIDWTEAADKLCVAIDKRAKDAAQSMADEVYEAFMYGVQDYLRENIAFNLGGELERLKKRAADADAALREVADALGVRTRAWPFSPDIGEVKEDALKAISVLREPTP